MHVLRFSCDIVFDCADVIKSIVRDIDRFPPIDTIAEPYGWKTLQPLTNM